jgi:hypothetical protein
MRDTQPTTQSAAPVPLPQPNPLRASPGAAAAAPATAQQPTAQQQADTLLIPDQRAKVLQLPAAPKTEKEAEEQKRVEYTG